ncbi:MAG TPA: hypothetical protein PKD10_19825 [Paracoccaceae bacterium]|nr:hypothetical protein [Paracoccaceae bacterium]HMO70241.1 hypothetical protein [Paracoccaceae bacterium]
MTRTLPAAAVVATLSALSGLPAAAACPAEAGDALRGIVVMLEDGTRVDMRRDAATGIVSETWDNPADPPPYREDLIEGVHLILSQDLDAAGQPVPGAFTRFRFIDGPLPALAEGASWSGEVEVQYGDGNVEATYAFSVGAARGIEVGGCAYQALPVTTTMREPDYAWASQIDHIPLLGVGLLRGHGEVMGDTTVYVAVSIAVAE